MTYDKIVKAVGKELGRPVVELALWDDGCCALCKAKGKMLLTYISDETYNPYICPDRPACRARQKQQEAERQCEVELVFVPLEG